MKSLIIILLVAVASVTAEGLNCTPNSRFKMACNTCICSKDGTSAACTDMACPEWEQQTESKQVCEPRAQFKEYCNTCFCASDGMTYACTRMACDPAIWNRDGSLKLESQITPQVQMRSTARKVCKPRTHFKEYCNTCYCADDGQTYSCTRMTCDPEIWNEDGSTKIELPEKPKVEEPKQVCEPNTHFKKYCNSCYCAPDGTSAACTRMACDPRIWNEDGSLKTTSRSATVKESVYNKQCEPEKPFKHYCNTCYCSSRGTVDGCTRMYCSDLWNEDGTRKDENKDQACEPGKAFSPDGCKICICNEDGTQSLCTTKSCSFNSIETYADKEAKKWGPLYRQGDSCNPGESFYSQCNQCVCSRNGKSALCTLKTCVFQQ